MEILDEDKLRKNDEIFSKSGSSLGIDYDFENKYEDETNINLHCDKELHLLESLSAVTTHFAHVQFRLRQIIDAPLEEKETLLKDLEEYTFKGIPEIQNIKICSANDNELPKDVLIVNLKKQIAELQNSIKNLQNFSSSKSNENNVDHNFKICKLNEEEKLESLETNGMKNQLYHMNIVKKLSSVLQMINVHCKEEKNNIKKDSLNNKTKYNHWGDIRAQLELAITEVIDLALEPEVPIDSDYMSDSEEGTFYICNQKLASVVRKKLAPAIQNLMQHGLMTQSKSISVRNSLTFVIGCVPHSGSSQSKHNAHAWDLILKFYKMKNGDQFNSSPALKLSQSYNLDVGNHCTTSSTQKMLIAIGNIISSHSVYKRSFNSQFKAFICAGLNAKMLVNWLQLIYRSKILIEMYYEPWSYTMKTGFEDTFKSLEKLSHYHFNLPINIAIHQLQNIKDAF
ncbi:hypothetical protein PGB90_006785 [Kerria lacca]